MKILLCAVNAKYIHSNLAVRLLKAYACRNGGLPESQIAIAEYTTNHLREDVLADLYLQRPDVLLFSCYIWNWGFITGLLEDLRKVLPDTRIWAGGPEVSYDAEQILMDYPQISGVLIGEGEAVFRELSFAYLSGIHADLSQVKGICYRNGGQILRTKEQPLLSMDEIPFVYDECSLKGLEHKILYYETSRGCPFSCSYCLSSTEKKVRFRSLDKVLPELQFFLDHQVPQVKFVDRTFNADSGRSVQILKYLREHDNQITNFHFEVEGDLLTEQELDEITQMRPGLIQLEIGVQSVNPDTIRSIRRVMDLNRLKLTVQKIHACGNVHQHLDLIAGLPWEGYRSFAHSFNEVYAMEPAQLQLGFLKVLKGSPMKQEAEKYGIVYQQQAPYEVLYTRWLSYGEIIRLKKIEEMVERYYNSRQFTRTIRFLQQEFSSAFEMYEQLAQFYEEGGYYVSRPSRIYRYELLLQFARRIHPEMEELYRELLTFDLYLRENVKSRPSFSPDLSSCKEQIRKLPAEKQWHVEVFHYPLHRDSPEEYLIPAETPVFLAFDYDHRDPLDHNASVIHLM